MAAGPQKYRKKPVVIEAVEYDGTQESVDAVVDWAEPNLPEHTAFLPWEGPGNGLLIETLEGVMNASPGDYIIRGVKGELYPCKPDIFAGTYEKEQA